MARFEIQDSCVTYPAHESRRRLPVNFKPKDERLFAHELTKQLPGCHAIRGESVHIVDNSLYRLVEFGALSSYSFVGARSLKDSVKRFLKSFQILRTPRIVGRGTWVIDNWSDGYFHWLTDVLTRVELVNKYWNKYPIILPDHFKSIDYIGQSLEILGVPSTFIDQNGRCLVKEMYLTSHTAPTGNYNKVLLNNLAQRFRDWAINEPFQHTNRIDGRRIFVSRALAQKRKISNEQELVPLLEKHGFEIVYAENMTFKEQVKLFHSASVIAGLHGAGLANMLFMPSGSNVVEIRRSGDSHNNCFFTMASDLDFNYYYLLATPRNGDLHSGDCHVDTTSLSVLLSSL